MRNSLRAAVGVLTLSVVLGSCGGGTVAPASSQAAASTVAARPTLAPPAEIVALGKLRVAYRVQGSLIRKDPTGTLVGVEPDLAAEIARRMNVQVAAAEYATIDAVIEGARSGKWDITFDTIDPTKTDLAFTPSFIDIPLTYLVLQGSTIATIADVDRAGVRIAVVRGDSTERFLSASIKQATLVRFNSDKERSDQWTKSADVLPGGLISLIPASQALPGSRILDGSFNVNRWAIAVPKGKAEILAYLSAFVEDAKASGLIRSEIDKYGLVGVQVGAAP